ncbi:c-type cytochrome [Pandoraea sp.]|uniref:c-type cytochrome n=1 Tax=Pandoraea sp. TaxID=1883445 RepID=UPI0025FBCDDC|nr:c-type cytochrome [Pandoraea sp.]
MADWQYQRMPPAAATGTRAYVNNNERGRNMERGRVASARHRGTHPWWLLAAALASIFIIGQQARAQTAGLQAAAPAGLGLTIATHGTAQGVPACVSCHGTQGQGNAAAGFPRLAGLSVAYLVGQLDAFASGQRQNPVMHPFAKALTPSERIAVAAYFSQLPAPVAVPPIDDATIEPTNAGAWLANRGRWLAGLPACAQCHGPGGIGVGATFPPLAGQSAAYIASQLHAFQAGTRPPGPLGLMHMVAGKLSEADITAVSTYYGGLGHPVAARANVHGDGQ